MKRIHLIALYVLIFYGLKIGAQTSYFIKAHKNDSVVQVYKNSFYYNHKIYFVSSNGTNNANPIYHMCDSNGLAFKTVVLPWNNYGIGNFDFRNGFLIYSDGNSIYKIDSLGNLVWHTYIQDNCAGGGSMPMVKFLKNGEIILYGSKGGSGEMVIIRIHPLTGDIRDNPIGIGINSVNTQVPTFALAARAYDVLEFSNSSIFFLVTRNQLQYTENYLLKCRNDTTFNFINGIVLDNVVTNNSGTFAGVFTKLKRISNELLLSGAEYNGSTTDITALKVDSSLTVVNTRYPIKIKNMGTGVYSYNPSLNVNNNIITIATNGAPAGKELSIMSFSSNLNVIQWTGYELDNLNTLNGNGSSLVEFKNAGGNTGKLFAICSYSSNTLFKRSIIKTNALGYTTCGTVLTPTISTDSLHTAALAAFNNVGLNSNFTIVTTTTLAGLYTDSLECQQDVISFINEKEFRTNSFVIFPDPSSDKLNIQCGGKPEYLELLDLLGQTVKAYDHIESDRTVLEVGDLRSGIYFVRIRMGNETMIKKFVKD